jgi:hypothetical protein
VKYVLVDNEGNVTHTVDLASNVGLSGARTYFMGVKRIESKEFDKLWKVKTEAAHLKGNVERTDHPGYIEWWKDERTNLDIEKD